MNLLDFLRTKSFSKNVATATVLSQLILLASCLLTRLYDPSDFGLLTIYLASTSFLGVIACLDSMLPYHFQKIMKNQFT